MKKNLLLIIICFQIACQSGQQNTFYIEDNTLSRNNGIPADSLVGYFPQKICGDSSSVISLDSFQIIWYSSYLFTLKEPILYNYYLEQDIYRLLCLPAFNNAVVFSLNKKKNSVWLTIKELDGEPSFLDIRLKSFLLRNSLNNNKIGESMYDSLLSSYSQKFNNSKKKETVLYQERIQLTKKEWKHFEYLLSLVSLRDIVLQGKAINSMDGTMYILESHFKKNYTYIYSDDRLRDVERYLLELKEKHKHNPAPADL